MNQGWHRSPHLTETLWSESFPFKWQNQKMSDGKQTFLQCTHTCCPNFFLFLVYCNNRFGIRAEGKNSHCQKLNNPRDKLTPNTCSLPCSAVCPTAKLVSNFQFWSLWIQWWLPLLGRFKKLSDYFQIFFFKAKYDDARIIENNKDTRFRKFCPI